MDNFVSKESFKHRAAKKAACTLFINELGQVLSILRKEGDGLWGLIGGKVDPGESFEKAACREAKEESGLEILQAYSLFGEFDSNNCFTQTFLVMNYSGEIQPEPGLIVEWKNWEVLINSETSPFAEYNSHLRTTYLSFIRKMIHQFMSLKM